MERPDRNQLLSNQQVRSALAVAIFARVPVLLWGPPGEGKSATVIRLARQLGWPAEVVIGSICEASDFSGLPYRDVGHVSLSPPRWAREANAAAETAGGALVFLDELTTATPPVQAAMLRVVQERHVGDLRLDDRVAIVAAANPTDMAADPFELSAPLANRFCHLWFEARVDEWVEGMLGGWNATDVPLVVPEPALVEAAESTWRHIVTEFVSAKPNDFFRSVPSQAHDGTIVPTDTGGPFPTPRTWEMAARIAGTAEAAAAGAEVLQTLVAGCVGSAAASELIHFANERDLEKAEEVLAGRLPLPCDLRLDQIHAFVGAVLDAVETAERVDYWIRAWELVEQTASVYGVDHAYRAASELVRIRRPEWELPPESESPTLRRVNERVTGSAVQDRADDFHAALDTGKNRVR